MQWVGWGVAGTAVTGIIASSSRGALIGLAAVTVWLLLKSRKRVKALLVTIAFAGLVYAIIPEAQKTRFQTMGDDKTSVTRTTYWKHGLEIMRDHPILGIGYANWPEYHTITYGVRALPHNIFIEAGAELGYTGLLGFMALLACTFLINRRTREEAKRRGESGRFIFLMAHGLDGAMIGFVASGFFVTVLYYPFFWINLALTVALQNALRSSASASVPAPGERSRPWRDASRTPAHGAS
jgi:O-antigen ligase